jgi:hypothetical protein
VEAAEAEVAAKKSKERSNNVNRISKTLSDADLASWSSPSEAAEAEAAARRYKDKRNNENR